MAIAFLKSDPSDNILIEAFRQGGRKREWATKSFLNKHIYYVQKLSRQFRLTEEIVLDEYVDAIMAMHDHVIDGRFKGDCKLSTYVYRILYNKCCDLLKKKSTNTVELDEYIERLGDFSRSFLKNIIEKEEVEKVFLLMDKIGDACKQILTDWGYWGYKMDEIAERNGLANGDQAKKQKYRCLQKLNKILKD